eukprot:TRINITY_DN1908_c0_g1_i1.p1 TRINITY_DN1908_c0_g1~~TRINITY_DN1908_c0_g1_i1.p1  ORF type:complete len:311 (+),score=71.91 TRINITY_DN1908_c0_g1_i1:79-933(+)
MGDIKELASQKCFGGLLKRFSHVSSAVKVEMKFTVYLPPAAENGKCPVLWFLSGLECTDENFMGKAGAQKYAAAHGIILVAPDTSPRGAGIEGETESWDFGVGAGFYVDATEPKWAAHYNMYSYVTKELFDIVNTHLPVREGCHSIMGHSMGGHGALICALKNPGKYRSASAFAPICHPCEAPWGKKAFTGYLGQDNHPAWESYDATELAKKYDGAPLPVLVDQGSKDNFLQTQLMPEALKAAASSNPKVDLEVRMQEGYTHSYYFIATFVEDHIAHHAKHLIK